MNNEFVPKELSLKLKEIGFNESCFAYYVEEHNNVKIFSEPWSSNLINTSDTVKYASIFSAAMEPWSSNLTNTSDYFVGSDNFIPWFCTAPTINQVLRWFEKEHGMYVEWLIDMWGDNYNVSGDWICYTTFIWQVGKPRPKPHDEVGHGSWNAMALASINEMIFMLQDPKNDNKDELLDKSIQSNEQQRRLIQMMLDDQEDGLYNLE